MRHVPRCAPLREMSRGRERAGGLARVPSPASRGHAKPHEERNAADRPIDDELTESGPGVIVQSTCSSGRPRPVTKDGSTPGFAPGPMACRAALHEPGRTSAHARE